MLLFELLSDIVKIDDILLIIKNNGVTGEIKAHSLCVTQKDKWITIGENSGPAHMHLNSELVRSAEFIQEEKPNRTSFSVRFFDEDGRRVLAAFFTKMYDDSKQLIPERKDAYDKLSQKFSLRIKF